MIHNPVFVGINDDEFAIMMLFDPLFNILFIIVSRYKGKLNIHVNYTLILHDDSNIIFRTYTFNMLLNFMKCHHFSVVVA